ncbi:MAG: metal-dependent hydrolase [Burkholderiaceae bacterium]|nr:metal-dependent hydrolase [Sulfuritalea sp.]MCF8173867.1 metal-dependent hydrolase [Burkholderiaceae bacterium]MCF8185098.1 metal-dependent hydrolase [Polynucleobacter sp.]
MDILTHALMGAALAAAVVPRSVPSSASISVPTAQPHGNTAAGILGRRRLAALIGAAAGLLPDADALIQSGGDALLVLDYHRHFSHALAFVPFGALIAALLLWPLLRRRINFGALYVCALAGYLPHPLLDACTSYGTHLWLPFSQAKSAWNLIAVVDPLFTLLIAVPLFIFLRRPGSQAVRWSLALGLAYFSFSFFQQQRVETAAVALAQARGHQPSQLSVKPSMANLVLWRSLYVHDGRVQVDAFHMGPSSRHYPGESALLIDAAAAERLAAGDARRLRDIERFRVFSEGFIVQTAAQPGFVGDARYAMLPTVVAPIWGIEWRAAGALTEFVSRHDFSPAMRGNFVAMLLGRDVSALSRTLKP